MSKEEFLKIQTCVLKVNIHCDGCKQKVKKLLQKIDGVFTTSIDSEQGKVTVSGNVDPAVLIKKLAKSGKHAELWGAPKGNNNGQNQMANQLKNMQIDNGKGGNNNKGQKINNQNNNQQQQPKGGQPTPQQIQHFHQLQQMKGLQDLKLPQMKDMKMPSNHQQQQQQKTVKFTLPVDDDMTDDEFDDDSDDEFDDDEFDDEMDDPRYPLGKMKQIMDNGPPGPNMMNGMPLQLLNAQKGGAPNGGANGKKGGPGGGGGGNGGVPVQINMGGEGKNGGGGKKGGGGGGGNNNGGQNQVGKNVGGGGGGKPQDGKNGNNGGGGNKNGNGGNGNNMQMSGGKKGNNGAAGAMNDGFQKMGGPHLNMGQMGGMPMGQMGGMPLGQMGGMPMGQMGNISAVQGLPAAAAMGGAAAGGGPNGYFQGAGPDLLPGNPYQQQQQQQQQQQYLAAVMNQQRSMGNERFQPMIYARPPPAVNYMPQQPPPYPYPYPYPHPTGNDQYTNFFSDENTSSCNVM
ncbi:HEAVY METAL TRANSPORT/DETOXIFICATION DOMAIN PROTEIN [Salix koriyanagi]|uniref:HEAVY METAL TRANSPORT/DETOXIFICATION DOMAIN PROTEIN n=1 Tax=Salix koriyanagi TaxID=2511006 RepID=A0A9Q0WBG2_9ROSI|nr:HEAVY METAL TRANSPORT/DETOXIFICATION DOMAIN PROTEIN [Salix koriyanagi]